MKPLTYEDISFDGQWTAARLPLDEEGDLGLATFRATADRLPVEVPGEIHLDLMRAGLMEDPNVSDNARERCRWPEEHSWWYQTKLTVPEGFRGHQRQWLTFDGVDLFGQVFVNGRLAGTCMNAFAPASFNVKPFLCEGENELVVRVTSGMECAPRPSFVGDFGHYFGILDESLYGVRSWDQRTPLRKPAYSTKGWDWCDPLPNIGIWKGVRLEGRTSIVIDHVRLDTVMENGDVALEGEIVLDNLHPWSETSVAVEVVLTAPDGTTVSESISVDLNIGRSWIPARLVVPDPMLWWPNGMGDQPLYTLTVSAVCENVETDVRTQRIGLRTIELDRTRLDEGSRFCVKVNGEDVYCKGGNWAPPDLISVRPQASEIERLVIQAKNAHFTMLRVNGCGFYESDAFYDACDRAGILVWQDFAFTDAMYPDSDPAFVSLVRQEAEAAVKRLRHRASLALWCGNNECSLSMMSVWNSDPARPEEIGGVLLYHEVLPNICRFLDPARPYWPSTPSGGKDPNDEYSGVVHGLEAPGSPPPERWRETADGSRCRFACETWDQYAPPVLASIREYLKPEELSPESRAWKIHSNAFEMGSTAEGIRQHYGDPERLALDDLVVYGQMVQALRIANAAEALRFRKADPAGECSGNLIWSFNETWGEVGWAIVDHYLRPRASYYAFRRAAAPVKVIVRSRGEALVTRVVNDTLRSYEAVVRCGWWRIDGADRELAEHRIRIPANGMVEVATDSMQAMEAREPSEWLYAATLEADGLPHDQSIWLLGPQRDLTSNASKAVSAVAHEHELEISSPVYCHGVHLEHDGVLADNYFDLLPGIPVKVPILASRPRDHYELAPVLPIDRLPG
jgi:beta-mannosidase